MSSLPLLVVNSSSSSCESSFNGSQLSACNYSADGQDGATETSDGSGKEYAEELMIMAYMVFLVVGGIGNVTVFVKLVRQRRRRSRITASLTHLAIADLMVTFVLIPTEIGWRITQSWEGGEISCRVLQAAKVFGSYLSSAVLICIGLDRCLAVVWPLGISASFKRSKWMLLMSYIFSFALSIPQSFIYHLAENPEVPNFWQCVTFGYFEHEWQMTAYNLFCVVAVYFFPLLIITICYASIYLTLRKQLSNPTVEHTCVREGDENSVTRRDVSSGEETQEGLSNHSNRRHNSSKAGPRDKKVSVHSPTGITLRASASIHVSRRKTQRLTIMIVLVFAICWLPYVVMVLWYQLFTESAEKLNPLISEICFMFAVFNSIFNPFVYGGFGSIFKNFLVSCKEQMV